MRKLYIVIDSGQARKTVRFRSEALPMGSKLIRKDLVAAADYAGITKLCADALAIIKKVRG